MRVNPIGTKKARRKRIFYKSLYLSHPLVYRGWPDNAKEIKVVDHAVDRFLQRLAGCFQTKGMPPCRLSKEAAREILKRQLKYHCPRHGSGRFYFLYRGVVWVVPYNGGIAVTCFPKNSDR